MTSVVARSGGESPTVAGLGCLTVPVAPAGPTPGALTVRTVITVLGAPLHGPRERMAEARTRRSRRAASAHHHDTPRHRARLHHRRYPSCSVRSARW